MLRKTPILRARELETGIEIKQGLKGGESVIVEPKPELRTGQMVTVMGTATR
jgi:hypothetical protein